MSLLQKLVRERNTAAQAHTFNNNNNASQGNSNTGQVPSVQSRSISQEGSKIGKGIKSLQQVYNPAFITDSSKNPFQQNQTSNPFIKTNQAPSINKPYNYTSNQPNPFKQNLQFQNNKGISQTPALNQKFSGSNPFQKGNDQREENNNINKKQNISLDRGQDNLFAGASNLSNDTKKVQLQNQNAQGLKANKPLTTLIPEMYEPMNNLGLGKNLDSFLESYQQKQNNQSLNNTKATHLQVPSSTFDQSEVDDLISKADKKVASAQSKFLPHFSSKNNDENININSNKQTDISEKSVIQPFKGYHNADQLIATVDHSDIKNTQKMLFNSNTNYNTSGSGSYGLTGSAATNSTNISSMRPSLSAGGASLGVQSNANQKSTNHNTFKASQFTINESGEGLNQQRGIKNPYDQTPDILSKDNKKSLKTVSDSKKPTSIFKSDPKDKHDEDFQEEASTTQTKKAPSVRKSKVQTSNFQQSNVEMEPVYEEESIQEKNEVVRRSTRKTTVIQFEDDNDGGDDDEDFSEDVKRKTTRKSAAKRSVNLDKDSEGAAKKSQPKAPSVGLKKSTTIPKKNTSISGSSKLEASKGIKKSTTSVAAKPKVTTQKPAQNDENQNMKSGTQQRTNFVRLNMKQNYKPRMRGAAFTNKMMAKKSNMRKFNDRFKKKMMLEQLKSRDQVNAYGGLGKVGLGYEGVAMKLDDLGNPIEDELVPGFSASALKYVKRSQRKSPLDEEEEELENLKHQEAVKAFLSQEEEDEFLLAGDEEEMQKELEKIDEEIKEEDEVDAADGNFDRALYKIPQSDKEYTKILQQRFGHESFRPGQLEAIKILIEKKSNALVVLATGGGKSLVYQYVSLFLQGLILIVTPLISLMTDQLQKLPDFLPGASLNSQQNYLLKKDVIQAIKDKHIKVLFISPEKFFIEDFSKYERDITMVCVDEIHCASEWSHNFRPAYLKLHDMIKEKVSNQKNPNCVVLGLTATATKATQRSVCDIFEVQFPDHIVTEPNLSRMNLSLSITRDTDKLRGLMQLLSSASFKPLKSILIFATHKATCERLASHLNSNGINSQAYHAGKSDQHRQVIQKNFINNNIRVLVCTIAFSMGIDKSDIQSVIHYDMPKSIENYVQEIGRAGRDGRLSRCHMFLCNQDFYQIRRLILTDLLDNQNALKLTNKIIVEGKRMLLKMLEPEVVKSKKRKVKHMSGSNDGKKDGTAAFSNNSIEEFEYEENIKKYYQKSESKGGQVIDFSNLNQIDKPNRIYLFLDIKETLSLLDLKKEVVLTMLNSLEKTLPKEKKFFKLEGILPERIGMRFHSKAPEEMAQQNVFIKKYLSIAKECQGVYGVSLSALAYELDMNPFQIPKILFGLQSSEDISYETEHESFVLRLQHLPSGGQTLDYSQLMLKETRRIERNMVQKLNCMYFVARRVSIATTEAMLKKEKEQDDSGLEMYRGFSKQLNELINLYFGIEREEDMEVQIAGSEEQRNEMMPLIYINSHRDKATVESEMKSLLKEYHDQSSSLLEASERMKPLDVVKIMMGIYSERACIKRFCNNGRVWAKHQDYDYEDLMKVANITVKQYYLDEINAQLGVNNQSNVNGSTNIGSVGSNNYTSAEYPDNASKRRKMNPDEQ